MANEDYLKLEGGEKLIEFIILNSSITDADIDKWNAANAKKAPKDQESVSTPISRLYYDITIAFVNPNVFI